MADENPTPPLCKCGCGNPTSKAGGRWKPYRVGHNHTKNWASGKRHPRWSNGTCVDKYGYVLILATDHPRANNNGYVRRSWLVAEATVGRHLLPNEVVHHRNGNRQEDTPENLEVLTAGAHNSIHSRERCGVNHASAILTEEAVREIRRLRGHETGVSLAKRFGTSPTHISGIQHRRAWKHVD